MNLCLVLAIAIVVLLVFSLVMKPQESFKNVAFNPLLKYSTGLRVVKEGIEPTQQYALPQEGAKGRFAEVSKLLTATTKSNIVNPLDWKGQAEATCSSYNGSIAPRTPQDCPDSSFSFVTDLSRIVPGQHHAGCIQLGASSSPYCYSKPDGTYEPWWQKLTNSTP